MNYPKEPWKALHPKYGFDNGLVDADGMHISLSGDVMDRIVLCVNYCAGQPDAALELFQLQEQIDLKVKFFDEKESLKAQRDELLSLLNEILEFSNVASKEMTTVRGDFVDWVGKVQDAKAKCEAQS